MDVVKTRIQTQANIPNETKYSSVLDAVNRIVKEEGFRAFGKGLTARVLWIAPGTAITMAACNTFPSVLYLIYKQTNNLRDYSRGFHKL
jgi:solute carrier family 25 aspartate/glutamate transporter 12/13